MSEIYPVSRKADIVVQEFEHETLVYDLKTNKALVLNSTSSMVWQLCNGNNSIDEITNKMSVSSKQIVTTEMVWMSLEQLKKASLLENYSIETTPFEGLTRREMVRKIGFASVVALPVISSLVAPSAINAQSGCPTTGNNRPNGCPCGPSGNPSCTSGCCATTPSGNSPTGITCIATPGTEPPGSICRGGCECASGSCPPASAGNPRVCV